MADFDQFLKTKSTRPSPAPAPAAPPAPASTTPPPTKPAPAGPLRQQCQPMLRADSANLWGRIEQAVENIQRALLDACASLGIEAYVGRNNAFEFPFAARFECWMPPVAGDPHLTERVWAYFSVEPKPWHRYEIEYTVEIENRGRKKVLGKFGEMPEREIHALVEHLVRGGPKPSFGARIRQKSDSFWRLFTSVKNEPLGTRTDYLAVAGGVLITFGLLGIFGGATAAEHDGGGAVVVLAGLAVVTGIGITKYVGGRPTAVRSTGRPEQQPRSLRVYDSWSAVVFGAATSANLLRQRFLAALHHAPIDGFKAAPERIGYRVLDEPVLREQIVLTARRGILYCQIYEFGTDLYVGWQAFLNQGRWSEIVPGTRGIDRATGARVEVRSVTAWTEGLCEYDYADTNCLTEWTHAQLATLVRQLMKDLQVDQEIDFKIVRGDRPSVQQSAGVQKPDEQKTGLASLFKRKA